MRSPGFKASKFAAGALVLVAGTAVASAGVSNVFMEIEASNASGSGSFQVLTQDVAFDAPNNTYTYFGFGIPIQDGANTIALMQNVIMIVRDADFNPQISMTFAGTAGSSATDISIRSAQVTLGGGGTRDGAASVGLTISDTNGDGAGLAGNGLNGFAYEAFYNGMAPGGAIFAEAVSSIVEPQAFGSESDGADIPGSGHLPMGLVSDISARVSFNLTTGDSFSGTSTYALVPEPSSLLLLLVPGLTLAARRRQG